MGKGKIAEIPKDREKNFTNLNADFKTKLTKKEKIVLITFKNMTLTVMESDGTNQKIKEKTEYRLGDIGISRYCSRIKEYICKGYEVVERTDNSEEMRKEMKKRGLDA
jgi:hypothetical protein